MSRSHASVLLISSLLVFSCATTVNAQEAREPDAVQETKEVAGAVSGIVTVDGKPVAGIVVNARRMTVARRTLDQMDGIPSLLSARTDREGRYQITNLQPGEYLVSPAAPAYPSMGPAKANAPPGTTVESGKTTEGVNFTLQKGAVITGRVLDPEGRPIIGAPITVLPEKGPEVSRGLDFGDAFATDDRGIYRIYGLPAGRYVVGCGIVSDFLMPQPDSAGRYGPTFHPGVTDRARARPIELHPGDEATNIDIRVGAPAKGASVSGRVIDAESGKPVTSGFVGYARQRASGADDELGPGGGYGMAPIGPKGEFRFESLPPGHYQIDADALEFVTGGSGFYSDPAELDVGSADINGVEVKVHLGASISGVVVVENAPEGDRRSNLSSLVISADNNLGGGRAFGSRIAADGGFRIGGLKSGMFALQIDEPGGFSPYYVKRIEKDGIDLNRVVELQANQNVSGVRVTLVYGSGAIHGRVTCQECKLPPGTHVQVIATLLSDEAISSGTPTNGRGDFAIENLPPGEYEVEATIVSRSGGQRPSNAAKQRVSLLNNATVEISIVLIYKPGEN
jgi:protocatechuate 3,4-dioxygenase beta subunit